MKFLLDLFRKTKPLTASPVQRNLAANPDDEEIPRYPPFAKGLPAASVDRVLASQSELVDCIRHTLGLPDKTFAAVVMPVIARYAAFTHLLPASEAHHHRGAGGLFRHGLEVAYWAALASEGVVFGVGTTPLERKSQEPRWRLAVCLAGLLHDIGKPVSDLSILDREGNTQWNPYLENLTDWAEKNSVDRYFLRWRDKRHQRHGQFSVLVAERVLTAECLSHLTLQGPEIMQSMLEAIAGVDRGGVFHNLVLEADQKSVERDLKANHIPVDASLGVPVEKYLLDAMRRLIGQGQWTANTRGSRVWHFKDGLHVVWKAGAQEITELLARDRIPGIPRDPDTLADILIERGLAIPRQDGEGRAYRYWRMAPSGMDVALYMLRLSSPELVYNGETPVVIDGRWVDDDDQDASLSKGENQKPALNSEGSAIESGNKTTSDNVSQTSSPANGQSSQAMLDADQNQSPNPSKTITAKPDHDKGNSNSTPSLKPSSGKTALVNGKSQPEMETDSTKSKPDNQPVTPSVATRQPVQTTPLSSDIDDNLKLAAKLEAKHWLSKQGEAGEWLRAAMIANSDSTSGMANVVDGQVFLSHPDMALKLDKDPSESLQLLDKAGWIETDLRTPMRKVREIGGIRGIMLNKEASRCWLALTGEGELQPIQAKPKSTSNASEPKDNYELPSASKEKTKPKTDVDKTGNADKPGTLTMGKPTSKPIAFDNPLSAKDIDGAKPTIPAKPKPAFQLEVTPEKPNAGQPKPANKPEPAPALKPLPPSPVDREFETDAVGSLIRHIREGKDLPCPVTETEEWLSVPYSILDWHVDRTVGLTRSKLIVSLHRHPDVQLEGNQVLKIRKLSD
jgi:hypothetical protein